MGVFIVLQRSYCVCLKTKKKDVPFQHGKGRFQATTQEGTKQLSQSEKCRLPVTLRAGSRPVQRGRPTHLEGRGQLAGPQVLSWKPPLLPSGLQALPVEERTQGQQVTVLKFQREAPQGWRPGQANVRGGRAL